MAVLTFADTIRLKDGSIIKGKIVRFDGGKFTVLIDDGARQRTLNFNAEEVESIVFDANPMPVSNNDTLNPSPPKIKTEGDTTIITVGQKNPADNDLPDNSSTNTNFPQTNSPKVITSDTTNTSDRNTPPDTTPNTTVITAKPITIKIPVLADNTSNGWTNSGWVVRKGQKIRIRGSGRVSLGNGRYSTPNGISTLPDNDKLVKNQATGGLIAVIGADNNDFIFIGESNEFIATRDGDLFLGVNEGNLNDNSGSFEVTIEIDPNMGN
jgi:hypothetical protein